MKVFQPDIQYVVPIFQCRYVWNETDQWSELWEDLIDVLEDVERVELLLEAGAEQPIPSHFLGAIVCDQSLSTGSDIDERPLIDGQQRLTTLQLVLGAALALARSHEAEQAISLLSKLVVPSFTQSCWVSIVGGRSWARRTLPAARSPQTGRRAYSFMARTSRARSMNTCTILMRTGVVVRVR